jgi:hypothetical protein
MTASRRTRTGTAASSVRSFEAATAEIAWPSSVPAHPERHADELVAFRNLIEERSSFDWTAHAVHTTARAAVLVAFVTRLGTEVSIEGPTAVGGRRGDQIIVNPKLSALATANAALTALLRQIGSATPITDRRQLRNAAVAERSARDVISRAAADELIA